MRPGERGIQPDGGREGSPWAVVGLDGGGSRTRAVALDLGTGKWVYLEGPGSNLQSRSQESVEDGLGLLLGRALGELRSVSPPEGVHPRVVLGGGFAGAGHSDVRNRLSEILARLLAESLAGWAFGREVIVATDVEIALRAGALGGPGAALIAGTGCIAYGETGDGRAARAGGFGYLLGDEGGGFDLGRRAIAHALRSLEGRAPQSDLARTVLESFGGGPEEVIAAVYGSPDGLRRIADTAKAVFAAAAGRDPEALRLLYDTAGSHADLLLNVRGRLRLKERDPAVVAGGLYHEGSPLFSMLKQALEGRGQAPSLRSVEGRTVCGAVHLALERTVGEDAARRILLRAELCGGGRFGRGGS